MKNESSNYLSMRRKIYLSFFLFLLSIGMVLAQIRVTGHVADVNGEPVIGATIQIKGTGQGTVSDIEGNFNLNMPQGSNILVISYVGMKSQELTATSNMNIVLVQDSETLEEIVVVGYGTQKKGALTGAVAAISGEDLVITKNENAQNMITGKLPGVRVSQRSAEPGSFSNSMDIRAMGTPLIVIDGIPRNMEAFQRLDPNDIENISVLKDATAAVYGVRAANGVVLVTTKKGSAGKNQLDYSGSFSWQIPSGLPPTLDATGYMTLRNERSMHNINGGNIIFDEEDFAAYETGEKVSTDWYPLVFKSYAPQTQHSLSATGGTDRINYYLGLGYVYQGGFFQSDDLNYEKYNIRANVSTKIADNLTFDVNMNFIMDQQNRPYEDSWWTIRGFWRQGPHIPAYANNDPTRPYHGLIEGDNPISFINADIVGYKKYNRKWIQPAASMQWDVPWVQGLFLKGQVSYDWYLWDGSQYKKEYNQYRYDQTTETYQVFTRNSPSNVRRENVSNYQLLTQSSIGYSNSIESHNFNGLLVWETQKRVGDNFNAQRNLILQIPYLFAGVALEQQGGMTSDPGVFYEDASLALVGTFHYDYASKYLLDFIFRNDGSSRFPTNKQWGFFPSIAAGWRISEEAFFREAFPNIGQLKLRTSYGKVGDDGALRYQFLTGYNYPTGGSDRRWFTGGYVFDGNFYASADNKGIPNPNITWYTAKTFDIGFDFVAWNGLLGITADYFQRKREGLLATKYGGIPTVVGANLPQENINSDINFGGEIEISHRNRINDFTYGLKSIFSIVRIKRLYVERGPIGSSWSNWKNNQNDRYQGVNVLLPGDGRYQSWEDIWNSEVYLNRTTVPGDYRYEDWNGDGEINDNDRHPMRFNQDPWMNFSLSGDAQYKGVDLAFLLQGAGMASVPYGEQLREPLWGSGDASAMVQFLDRWHPSDATADPYDPAVTWIPGHFAYTGTLPDYWSTFNVEDATYLRLKSVELGYTIPTHLVRPLGISNLRVYANAYNLFTLTKVKYMDPEHTNDLWGYIYPLNKTVSVGLNVTF